MVDFSTMVDRGCVSVNKSLRYVFYMLLVCVFLTSITSAYAVGTPPTRPNTGFDGSGNPTPDAWEIIQNPALYPPPVKNDNLSPSDIDPVINKARVGGGILPRLKDFAGNGKFVLGSVALSIGAQYGLGGYIDAYQLIRCGFNTCTNASATTGAGNSSVANEWDYINQGFTVATHTSSSLVSGNCTGGSGASGINVASGTAASDCAPLSGWYLWVTCSGACNLTTSQDYNILNSQCASLAISAGGNLMVPGATCINTPAAQCKLNGVPACAGYGGNAVMFYATDAQYESSIKRTPASPAVYNSQTTKIFYNYGDPGAAGKSKPGAGAGYGTPGSQTDPEKGAENAIIACLLAGTCGTGAGSGTGGTGGGTTTPPVVFQPITLPQPSPYQTYQDYIDYLRSKGWVGTATVTGAATGGWSPTSAVRAVVDQGVVSVLVGGTAVLTYDSSGAPVAWPANAPVITSASQDISMTVVPVGQGTSPATCSLCAIDWTPIESIAFGTKFPFGFFTWVGSFFSGIPTGGSCPTLSIGKPAAIGGGTQAISFCSTQWESWRPTVFLVIECFLTLAGVTFLAQKILGFGGGDAAGVEEG